MNKIKIAYDKGYTVTNEGNVLYKGKQRKLCLKSKKQQYYCFVYRLR